MNKYYTGIILVIISAICFALLPIFAVFAYRGNANISTILFLRFALAAVLLFSYLAWKKERLWLEPRVLLKLIIIGGVFYTLQSSLYFASVKYLNVSLQALLFYTYPIFVAVLGTLFFKVKFTGRLLISIFVSLLGMVLVISTSFGVINLWGALLALGAAIVYSLYINLSNLAIKKIPSDLASAYICLFASLAFLLVGTLSHNITFDFHPTGWWPILAIAFFSTTVSIVTFFRGMEILGSNKAATISMIEPVITILISSLVFNSTLGYLQWVGGLLVLFGAYIVVSSRSEQYADHINALIN